MNYHGCWFRGITGFPGNVLKNKTVNYRFSSLVFEVGIFYFNFYFFG